MPSIWIVCDWGGDINLFLQNDNKFQWKSNDPNVASHLDVQFQAIKGERKRVREMKQ